MKYTAEQLTQYAWNAGFRGDALTTAVAVALAESDGDPDAYNPESEYFNKRAVPDARAEGKGSTGLWQIFVFLWPTFDTWNLRDPQANACAAFIVWRQSSNAFWPWATYHSGAYKKYMPEGVSA